MLDCLIQCFLSYIASCWSEDTVLRVRVKRVTCGTGRYLGVFGILQYQMDLELA